MKVLGIRYGHDSAAALIIDGKIIADVAEERFSRIKNDTSFPIHAIKFCLKQANISSEDLDCLAIPTKFFPEEFRVFFDIPESTPINSSKPFVRKSLSKVKKYIRGGKPLPVLPIYQKPFKLSDKCMVHLCEHHLAHAASAYFTSGFTDQKTLIVTMDGIGDNVSVAIWKGENNRITELKKWAGNASIGWFYGNATEGLDWKQSSDEWKVMGLAPYGTPQPGLFEGFHPVFKNGELLRPHNYGGLGRWNDHGSNHYHGKDSVELKKFLQKVSREDYAAEVQRVTEEQAFEIILPWLEKVGTRNLCCAGGCFLNVKFNQKLWYKGVLDNHWIYPNAGDAGLAVGAAINAFYRSKPDQAAQKLTNLYLGPEFTNDDIEQILIDRGLDYEYHEDISQETAKHLVKNRVVGWFQGRMESGPRALGNRSILMSPLNAENKDIINSKIKFREKFRPFCPSIIYEKAQDYLDGAREELFMVTSFEVGNERKNKIPAVVHADGTARPQMVKRQSNERYYDLITKFGKLTGEYVILNTSFNVKGEPIVCNPVEAIKCFYSTGMDVLVMGNYIIKKPTLTD